MRNDGRGRLKIGVVLERAWTDNEVFKPVAEKYRSLKILQAMKRIKLYFFL